MAVAKRYAADVEALVARRHENGGDFWATADGRWGSGSPFSTFDCALMLSELGLARGDPLMKGAAQVFLDAWREDGRIRPAPKGAVYPCHTANAARVLGRLGFARDARLRLTYEHLLETQHSDGGWRCNTVKLGKSAGTDASNPGVTLNVLDALRFSNTHRKDRRLDAAVDSLLKHWRTRNPRGPCHFGIGTLFGKLEYPFFRYNLFAYVYVLSFYPAAHDRKEFREARAALEAKLVDGAIVVESPKRGLAALAFCAKGKKSAPATKRYREIVAKLAS